MQVEGQDAEDDQRGDFMGNLVRTEACLTGSIDGLPGSLRYNQLPHRHREALSSLEVVTTGEKKLWTLVKTGLSELDKLAQLEQTFSLVSVKNRGRFTSCASTGWRRNCCFHAASF